MKVETYECSETAAEPIEASEEAVRLIDQLGLDGQKELICPNAVQQNARCPYSIATEEQLWVFRTLCPVHTKLANYNRSPIPLRVLQVAAHADSLGFFTELQVWDHASSEVSDPVLVGIIGESYSIEAVHLLARWADALDEWPTMLKLAAAKWRAKAVSEVKQHIADLTKKADQLANATDAEIIASDRRLPHVYGMD